AAAAPRPMPTSAAPRGHVPAPAAIPQVAAQRRTSAPAAQAKKAVPARAPIWRRRARRRRPWREAGSLWGGRFSTIECARCSPYRGATGPPVGPFPHDSRSIEGKRTFASAVRRGRSWTDPLPGGRPVRRVGAREYLRRLLVVVDNGVPGWSWTTFRWYADAKPGTIRLSARSYFATSER